MTRHDITHLLIFHFHNHLDTNCGFAVFLRLVQVLGRLTFKVTETDWDWQASNFCQGTQWHTLDWIQLGHRWFGGFYCCALVSTNDQRIDQTILIRHTGICLSLIWSRDRHLVIGVSISNRTHLFMSMVMWSLLNRWIVMIRWIKVAVDHRQWYKLFIFLSGQQYLL